MMGRSRVTSLPSMMNLSKYQVHGFQLLEEELAFVGYDKHLESRKALSARKALKSKVIGSFGAKKSRSPGGDLVPTWLDLMMWAVLIGEDRLARLLWRKTDEPMRAAIMGARVANKIAAELGPDHLKYEELKKQAQQYEQWAIDVLDEIKEDDMAIALLTVVPKKHVTDESGKSADNRWADPLREAGQVCLSVDLCALSRDAIQFVGEPLPAREEHIGQIWKGLQHMPRISLKQGDIVFDLGARHQAWRPIDVGNLGFVFAPQSLFLKPSAFNDGLHRGDSQHDQAIESVKEREVLRVESLPTPTHPDPIGVITALASVDGGCPFR